MPSLLLLGQCSNSPVFGFLFFLISWFFSVHCCVVHYCIMHCNIIVHCFHVIVFFFFKEVSMHKFCSFIGL